MNVLPISRRVQVVAALVEGASINATCRMTGVSKHTVLKLLKELGCACTEYYESRVRNLCVRRVQCDFCRVHKSLRVTPAMEAGLTDHVCTLEELIALRDLESEVAKLLRNAC